MLILELEEDEREALVELLQTSLVDLARELRRTESFAFRDALKAKEKCLERLAERLRPVPVA
jgi:hypothetical protein